MAKESAGILFFRRTPHSIEVMLAHPGGPFWQNKDLGAWTIPKGEIADGEDIREAAFREVKEELGITTTGDDVIELSPVKLKSGKKIYAWAMERDIDVGKIRSNTFELVWPPGSGQVRSFPEIDRAAWFSLEEGMEKINPGQRGLLDELEKLFPV
jgi:predicted NUDIX family NTP pyrophosphohydrolase